MRPSRFPHASFAQLHSIAELFAFHRAADCACHPEALLLTHSGAGDEEMEPYLSTVLDPLNPLVLYGRNALEEPQCHPQECVYYAWQAP